MTRSAILLTLLLVGVAVDAGADAPVRLNVRARVEVQADVVRVGDLTSSPLPPDLAQTVLCGAPRAGRSRHFDRATLLREMVRAGVRPLPVLEGASRIEIVRPGRTIAAEALAAKLLDVLLAEDPPIGALDQRFAVHGVGDLLLGPGTWELRVDGDMPRAGRGSVAIALRTSGGERRRFFVALTREVLLPVLRTRSAAEAGAAVEGSVSVVDTLWSADRVLLDGRLPIDEADGRWTLRRSTGGGHVLLARDVRPTPVVRRGELVEWIVERGDLHVRVNARSRSDGAVGDWILVESPFDRRLRRVCVVGPHRVADHPPRDVSVLADSHAGGTP